MMTIIGLVCIIVGFAIMKEKTLVGVLLVCFCAGMMSARASI